MIHNPLVTLLRQLDLTTQERKYIFNIRTTLPQFHCLPKLHKTPLKGRPIVGATDWATTNASIILDIFLSIQQQTFSFHLTLYLYTLP